MPIVQVAEEQPDRYSGGAPPGHLPADAGDLSRRQFPEHLAVGTDTLRDLDPVTARHQVPRLRGSRS